MSPPGRPKGEYRSAEHEGTPVTDRSQIATTRRAALAALLMGASAAAGYRLTPTRRLADLRPARLNLNTDVPGSFGDWRIDPIRFAGIVNPETEELLNRLYNQQLSRTYINGAGQRVMLSIVYGENQRQREGNALHYPEVCYPAQGFEVKASRAGTIDVPGGSIPVKRLETQLGSRRTEPVTYWTTLGDQATSSGMKRRLAELRYGLKGIVADGVLFRVSSIGADSQAEFLLQDRFVVDLIGALPPALRQQLAGVG
jgi:EpsI family protein